MTGKTKSASVPAPESLDLSDAATRMKVAGETLAAVRAGTLSAHGGQAIASLLRTAEGTKVRELEARVAELSAYASDLESRLAQLSPRGR